MQSANYIGCREGEEKRKHKRVEERDEKNTEEDEKRKKIK